MPKGWRKPDERTSIEGVDIEVVGNLIRAAMKGEPTTKDLFCELLCGGADERYAFTQAEAGIYLKVGKSYGRVLMQRVIKDMNRKDQCV